ncbi:MAG: TRAP transporter small permease [Alphaproteobacteria bacterium]|nr:TRAP transporter small permease [Alphaproteobacteria bacterium]
MSDDGGLRPKTLIDHVFWYLAAGLMLVMTGAMLYAVVARYFFNRPPIWSEDVPRTLFVWMVMLVLGFAIKLGLNIRVTTFTDMLPRGLRLAVESSMHILVLGMIALLFWQTLPILELKATQRMLSTGWAESILVWPILIGCVLAFLYQARQFADVVQAFRTGKDPSGANMSGAGMG